MHYLTGRVIRPVFFAKFNKIPYAAGDMAL